MGDMNKQKVARAIALVVAVMAGGWVSAAEPQKAPPMGEQFTSAKTVPLTDGPRATDVATAQQKAREQCKNRVVDSLIESCARKVREEQVRREQQQR